MHNLLCAWDFNWSILLIRLISLQADLNRRASEATELRNSLAFHETASTKAKEELVLALTNMEKLKKDFEAERSTWEVQRDALEKRAKDAEAALNPVTQELSGLKQQIENMTSAIFGEYLSLYGYILAIFCSAPV